MGQILPSDINAAVLKAQLSIWMNSNKSELYQRYYKAFSGIDAQSITLPVVKYDTKCAYVLPFT